MRVRLNQYKYICSMSNKPITPRIIGSNASESFSVFNDNRSYSCLIYSMFLYPNYRLFLKRTLPISLF